MAKKPSEATVVFLHSCEGLTYEFSSKEELFETVGYYWLMATDYRMVDEHGNPLSAADFEALHKEDRKNRPTYLDIRYPFWDGSGPVPGIRRQRGGRCCRRIRHMNERRWATPVLEEGEVAPRAARNAHNLPNPWDDYGFSNQDNRNWKRFRKHQWKR